MQQRERRKPIHQPSSPIQLAVTLAVTVLVVGCHSIAGAEGTPSAFGPDSSVAVDAVQQPIGPAHLEAATAPEASTVPLDRELARRQDRIDRLEADARDAATERAALQKRLTGYTVVRAIAVVAVGAALGLTLALLLAMSRAREEHRRRTLLASATESLREALERYRSLGAQLELKYQNLYRHTTPTARARSAATVLLADYERERVPVEMAIRRSEADLEEVLTELKVA
jgi:hypothetical protein